MRFFFVVLFSLTFCKPSSGIKTTEQSVDLLHKIVQQELGDNPSIEKNQANTFALAFRSENKFLKYIVVRLQDNQVVLREKIRGSVTWTGNMQIKESHIPGMVRSNSKPEDFMKTIDLNQFVVHFQMKKLISLTTLFCFIHFCRFAFSK